MYKKIITLIVAIVIVFAMALNLGFNTKATTGLSDVLLANTEALANNELAYGFDCIWDYNWDCMMYAGYIFDNGKPAFTYIANHVPNIYW